MRPPLIAGNWKMHKTVGEAVDFARQLVDCFSPSSPLPSGREVVIAPAFTALYAVSKVLLGSAIGLAAQNVHDQPQGAYTGEISAGMLADIGCRYVIIGHSERRTLFGETNGMINRKIAAALSCNVLPIFCIGETLEEREGDITFSILERQVREGLNNLAADDIRRITIAYEPVWAIGTGRTASSVQAQEVHAFIRNLIESIYTPDTARALRIIYGGSVNAGNIATLMGEGDIDGALVGGASLEPASFYKIVKY
ncbi:MAG: Vitamin B12 import ATP-binding protein BtuD [Syntrophus sp. SKADARSKE-3]|nr:Vitamin B12 import ATP-binding protein BtuD [Syntrophus sp. SKADARSKE-3]